MPSLVLLGSAGDSVSRSAARRDTRLGLAQDIPFCRAEQDQDDRTRHSRVQQTSDRGSAASSPVQVIDVGAVDSFPRVARSRSWTDLVSTAKAAEKIQIGGMEDRVITFMFSIQRVLESRTLS